MARKQAAEAEPRERKKVERDPITKAAAALGRESKLVRALTARLGRLEEERAEVVLELQNAKTRCEAAKSALGAAVSGDGDGE